jgi:hypothetical protein
MPNGLVRYSQRKAVTRMFFSSQLCFVPGWFAIVTVPTRIVKGVIGGPSPGATLEHGSAE